jgi:hypothetical protein
VLGFSLDDADADAENNIPLPVGMVGKYGVGPDPGTIPLGPMPVWMTVGTVIGVFEVELGVDHVPVLALMCGGHDIGEANRFDKLPLRFGRCDDCSSSSVTLLPYLGMLGGKLLRSVALLVGTGLVEGLREAGGAVEAGVVGNVGAGANAAAATDVVSIGATPSRSTLPCIVVVGMVEGDPPPCC